MHPGFMHWWKEAQRQHGQYAQPGCGPGGCGPGGQRASAHEQHDAYAAMEDGGSSFGVRRPLRFMAHRLELNEKQVGDLAAVLDELKTERAQAAVDYRRSVGAIADSIGGDTFDEAAAGAACEARVKSAQRLKDAVVKALKRTHAMLDPEQRKQLAYLLRSGQLTI